jgi:hypothetical protein
MEGLPRFRRGYPCLRAIYWALLRMGVLRMGLRADFDIPLADHALLL